MFQFRIIGGFKPDGVELKVENEQFVNQEQEIIEMYSLPYKTFDFVFGTSCGYELVVGLSPPVHMGAALEYQ